jgi:signal transduction histidine kinase
VRRRLLVLVIVLVAGLVAALGLPLAVTTAERASQELFISRADDTARFADMAESALSSGRTQRLTAALARYDELYDTPVFVVDADARVIATSREGMTPTDPALRPVLLRGLAGRSPQQPHVLWPWDDRPYVVVEPVVRDTRILGAAVTISPTDESRAEVARRLGYVAAGGSLALLVVALMVAVPLVEWLLRPVRDLDEAAHAMESGRLATHVAGRTGPPELRRLATSFNAMADAVAAAVGKQREFVAQASHQLRNPLTALRLRLENAESYATDPAGRDELRSALDETDRLGAMVDSLLRLARAESALAQAPPRVLDVSAAIARRARAWRVAYERADVTLTVDVPERVRATCLPDLLDHALDALLDNALKFAPAGSVVVSARTAAGTGNATTGHATGWVAGSGADGGAVEIRVRDSGPGLPPEELARAGDRFWRSPWHQNVRGTGLGLATTRTLVEASGGSMELAAARSQGLEVIIRLPAAEPAAAPPEDPPPEGPSPEGSARDAPGLAGAPDGLGGGGEVSGGARGTSGPRRDAGPAGTS